MKMKACFLWVLTLGCTIPGAAADQQDPLLSPTIVLCLRPLRMAPQPGLPEAVESVKRLTSFARSQQGTAKKAVDALIFIFKDLFRNELELGMAENEVAHAERKALAREQLAERMETVGSPLSGPNPRLGAIYRQEAAEMRDKAARRLDEARQMMKVKLAAYNKSVSYFQSQSDTEVVVALASSLFAIVDRRLPGFDFKPRVSREWIEQQKRGV